MFSTRYSQAWHALVSQQLAMLSSPYPANQSEGKYRLGSHAPMAKNLESWLKQVGSAAHVDPSPLTPPCHVSTRSSPCTRRHLTRRNPRRQARPPRLAIGLRPSLRPPLALDRGPRSGTAPSRAPQAPPQTLPLRNPCPKWPHNGRQCKRHRQLPRRQLPRPSWVQFREQPPSSRRRSQT